MTIGIDASRANKKIKTGVEWYSYYLIRELKKISLPEINFVLYTPGKLGPELANLPANWRTKVLKWPLKYLWTQIRLSWEMIFQPPDVLFVPSHALPLCCRAKTVITIHDLGFERFPNAYPFWQRIYTRFVYQWAGRFADQIIVPSEFTQKELIQLYKVKAGKVKVIYLGYDQSLFQPIDDQKQIDPVRNSKKDPLLRSPEAKPPYGLAPANIEDNSQISNGVEAVLNQYQIKKPYLLSVGRLEKKKNIKNLLAAFTILQTLYPYLQLVLVGQPAYGYNEIKKLKTNNIVEVGHIAHQNLPPLYAGAECFVFPTLYEGFGLPILEAMACGCPVATSKNSSLPEVAGLAASYFDPQNVEEMAKTVLKILKDREVRETMIQKGLERVKLFSWEKCARETLRILLK